MRSVLLVTCLSLTACGGLKLSPASDESSSSSGSTSSGGEERIMFQGGNSFGECAGQCRFDISFGLESAELSISDWGAGAPSSVHVGDYTPAGLALVDGVQQSLAMASLLDQYGCPDCDDGGASWVSLHQADLTTTHTYEFANAPPEFLEYDALLQSIVQGLQTCQPNEHITPSPACLAQTADPQTISSDSH